MKTFRILAWTLAALALVALTSALPASAAASVNNTPNAAAFIDNATHSIPANGTLWYKFDYAGDRSQIIITLANGTNSGAGFNVFTPDQIGDWWETAPIGRGTGQAINCNTGAPQDSGACQANDSTWVGEFPTSGTYYVELFNNNNNAYNAQLTIQGGSVSLAPQTAAPSTATASTTTTSTTPSERGGAGVPAPATGAPAASTQPAMTNTDPGHASFIDNNMHQIPANGSLWYAFKYAGDRSQITVSLLNGNGSGVAFKVFTPQQIGDWWETAPIGQGTPQQIDCNTGVAKPEGQCQSNDLMWIGQFNAPGTYYVQVINNNSNATGATLMIQGGSVTLQ